MALHHVSMLTTQSVKAWTRSKPMVFCKEVYQLYLYHKGETGANCHRKGKGEGGGRGRRGKGGSNSLLFVNNMCESKKTFLFTKHTFCFLSSKGIFQTFLAVITLIFCFYIWFWKDEKKKEILPVSDVFNYPFLFFIKLAKDCLHHWYLHI